MQHEILMRSFAIALAALLGVALPASTVEPGENDAGSPLVDLLQSDGTTREELAGLYQALAAGGFEPPPCEPGEEMFDDVPASHLFCPWIEELTRRGITEGCDADNYCPGNPVSRGQMAVFIVRALSPGPEVMRVAGSNFQPRDSSVSYSYDGAGCVQRDTDVGDSWFTHHVQLPGGAVIESMRVYFFDGHGTFNVNSELWAFDGAGGTVMIAEADSEGAPGFSSADSGPVAHQVDNANQALVVVVSLQGGVGQQLTLCGIELRYQRAATPAALEDLAAQSGALRRLDPTAPDTGESN